MVLGWTLGSGAHRLGSGDVGTRWGDIGLGGVHKADAVLQQVQYSVAQDEAVQLKGLCAVKGLLHVRRDREGLVRAAPQRLHHLPHLLAHATSATSALHGEVKITPLAYVSRVQLGCRLGTGPTVWLQTYCV